MRSSPPAHLEATRRVRIDDRSRWLPDFRELFRYLPLVMLLGRRDITVRYRQTVLGTAWVFTGPLVSAGLFTFVFGEVAGLSSGGAPYFVFSYAGLLTWNLFSGALQPASVSIVTNAPLITKIYFPRLVVPLSTLAATLLNGLISFGVMLGLIAISGVGVSVHMVLLPLWICFALALAMGLALVFTATSVWHRDVNYFTPLFTQLLLFISPVAYALSEVPEHLRNLYLLNPLASIVQGGRWSLLDGQALPPTWAIVYSAVFSVAMLIVGLVVFSRTERKFADVI